MGRPRKATTNVTLTTSEIQLLVKRLGYKDQQSLIDDLAMGVIPSFARSEATTSVTPVAVGADKSEKVACPGSDREVLIQSKVSWADEVETEEGEQLGEGMMPDDGAERTKTVGLGQGVESGLSWLDIIKGNRTHGNGHNLDYYPPGVEVELTEEDWKEGEKLWRFTLAAQFGKRRPTYDEVRKWAGVNWKEKSPLISQLKPGIFLFEFHSEEQKQEVLMRNWSYYHKFPVVFKPWDLDKSIDQIQFDSQPMWIQLPELPPRYWPAKNLSKIVSFIGTPVSTDRLTANRTKLDYARVLVEVKKSVAVLPEVIPIRGPNGVYMQKILYEKDMKRCSFCGMIGHEESTCWKKKAAVKKTVTEKIDVEIRKGNVAEEIVQKEVTVIQEE